MPEVDHVGGAVEHRSARGEFERLAVALDAAAAGQRQDHHLDACGVAGELAAAPRSTTCRLDSVQPADSGVTSTV